MLNRDLQIQLDQVLQQAQDPNSKGNSLFAEVRTEQQKLNLSLVKEKSDDDDDVLQLEDKRAEMERQLISMKVQYQSLQKVHAFNKQQMQRMKVSLFVRPTAGSVS